jgi:hypothetical protein
MVTAARPPQQAYAAIAGTFVAGLAAAGINDFLQAGFAAVAHKSSELEQRSQP